MDNRHLACLMPCTIAVYEADGDRVMMSKMNTGLMGKVFGGTVARVMGSYVASDEDRMLKEIYAKKKAISDFVKKHYYKIVMRTSIITRTMFWRIKRWRFANNI